MVARTRNLNSYDDSSFKINLDTGLIIPSHDLVLSKVCKDVIGNYGGLNTFDLQSSSLSGGLAFGKSFISATSENIEFVGTPTSPLLAQLSTTGPNSKVLGQYRQKALAMSGIGNPAINIPQSILELKDIPRMLYHAGNLLHGLKTPSSLRPLNEAAAATLAFQFGWRPLIQDILKLSKFQNILEKRRQAINEAFFSKTGYHGHAVVDAYRRESYSQFNDYNLGPPFTGTQRSRVVITEKKAWATVPWTPKEQFRELGYDHAYARSFRDAIGFNFRNITLATWKVMPWSWFIDYFATCSEFLNARNNLIDYQPQPGTIMVQDTITTIDSPVSIRSNYYNGDGQFVPSTCSITETRRVQSRKQRFVITSWGTPRVNLKLPILDSFKLSVLGSLLIQKISKS